MNIKQILLILALGATTMACEKQEIPLFELQETGVYFQHGNQTRRFINSESYSDSTAFSFSVSPIKTLDTTLVVRIRTLGNVKDYDRPVKLAVDVEHTTAVEGQHYVMDLRAIQIPAGASEISVPVKFKRTNEMLSKNFSLSLKLEENDHFKIYMTRQKNTNVYAAVGADINADRFKFIVGEIYTMPSYWSSFAVPYFGPWTAAKYRYVNSLLNWTPENWQAGGRVPIVLGRFGPGALTVRNALQALADAGTPMREIDGSPMQLGTAYQVNY